jgi:nucleoside-diphosphate-sugar epimerase
MRCLVTGAYGFIGSEVVAALERRGVEVVSAGRDLELGRNMRPDIDWIACDFNKHIEVAQWLPRLAGIDAVVNCVGVLQQTAHDDADRIHAQATSALFEACAAAGIKRIVHARP